MNLNENPVSKARGRGRKNTRGRCAVFNSRKTSLPSSSAINENTTTSSSELNWGRSHISVPNTTSSSRRSGTSKSDDYDTKVILALTEGRGDARCEVGIAAICISRPHLILCQISDTHNYINTLTKINIFEPSEIIVPSTFMTNVSGNRLIDAVKKQFPNIKCITAPRSTFNKVNGMDTLTNICIPSFNGVLLVLQHRYYALAAASALLTYIQEHMFVYYSSGTIKIEYQESEDKAVIDISTADRLELVCSADPMRATKYSNLFGVLNHCQTKIGARNLRSSILQPPCSVEQIEERLNCVSELMNQPDSRMSLQIHLHKISNIDALLSIGTIIPKDAQQCSNRHLNYVLVLNSLIELVSPLEELLSNFKEPFFVQLRKTLNNEGFDSIKTIIRGTIHDYAHPAKGANGIIQRCFAIKPEINGLLDLVRKTFSERSNDMRDYVKALAEKYDLPLTLGNNQTKGHHIVLALNSKQKRSMKKSDLPEEFFQVQRLAGSFTMKTAELVNLSTRLDVIMEDILKMSNVTVHALIVEIKKYIPLFYTLCEEIALLDVLLSLAETSSTSGYARPKFGEYTEVTNARHPLLDFLLPRKPIANDIICSDDFNVHIITGPNGSGKSIYIRQVLLLQVMAQVGSYVPAECAVFRPADRMFARIYLEDNAEYGASSFVLEMLEIKYILSLTTEKSLVIIDELGRSTSAEEGTALAMAIVEQIGQSSTYLYVTTHFVAMAKLYHLYPDIKVWQLETIPSPNTSETMKLDFKHYLKPGVTTVRRYGVYIVRSNWSGSILTYIDDVLNEVCNKSKSSKLSKLVSLAEKSRLKYNLEAQFRKLKSQNKLTIFQINQLLQQYQNDLLALRYFIDIQPLRSDQILTNNAGENTYFFESHPQFNNEMQLELAERRMTEMFTPDSLIQNQMQTSINHDRNRGDTLDIMSEFIAESPDNINKLVPDINIEEERSIYRIPQEAAATYTSPRNNEDLSELWMKDLAKKGLNTSMSRTSNPTSCQLTFSSILSDRDDPFMPHSRTQSYKSDERLEIPINDGRYSTSWIQSNENILSHNVLTAHPSWITHPEEFLSPILPLPEPIDADNITLDMSHIIRQNYVDNPEPELLSEQNAFSCSWNQKHSMQGDCFTYPDTPDWLKNKKYADHSLSQTANNNNCTKFLDHSAILPLQSSITASSSISHCPNYQFYNRDDPNITLHVLYQSNDMDMESVKEELEVCSKIFADDDDDDDQANQKETAKVTSKLQDLDLESIQESLEICSKIFTDDEDFGGIESEKQQMDATVEPKEYHEHIFPIVTIIEGPNDTSQSFGEESEDEIPKEKIKILSDIKIIPEHLPRAIFAEKIESVLDRTPLFEELTNGTPLNGSKPRSSKKTMKDSETVELEDSVGQEPQFGVTIPLPKQSPSPEKEKIIYSMLQFSKLGNLDQSTSNSSSQNENSFKKDSRTPADISGEKNIQNAHMDRTFGNAIPSPKQSSSPIKERTIDISAASKLRNLDQVSSSPQDEDNSKTTTSTSLSSASRKRNLDQGSTDPSDTPLEETSTSSHSKTKSITIAKYQDTSFDGDDDDNDDVTRGKKKPKLHKKRFIPPRKLSAKEIRQEFEEQDKKMLENLDSSTMSTYCKQLLNRPTVRQVQSAQHLALFRRTSSGFQEIPVESRQKKKRKLSFPIRKEASIDMTIFSDKNAKSFEAFLNSKQDIKTFSFNLQKTHEVDAKIFNFNPIGVKVGEYTDNSVTKNFTRKSNENFEDRSVNPFTREYVDSQKSKKSNFSQFSLTPEGFFKRNKEDMTKIMNKYLKDSSNTPQTTTSSVRKLDRKSSIKNIFENTDLSNEDLTF